MSGKFSRAVVVVAIAGFLCACAKEPPKCSDADTFALVKKIILDQLGGGEGLSEQEIADSMKIEFPRASALDEKIKKYSCEAKLTVGGMVELPITYESQLDDKNQHIVAVGGIRRGDLISLQAGMMEGIRKSRADHSTATQPPGVAAAVVAKSEVLPDLSKYVGKHPTEVFNEPMVTQKFKSLLGAAYEHFIDSLSVGSDLEVKGDYYFGSGCAPHVCTIEEAAFVIHKTTGDVLATQLVEGKEISSFGVTSASNLPGPLRDWYKEHGGTQ